MGGDGRVYIGRGWDRVGAHTKGYNDVSVAISFMGNFMEVAPSQAMLSAAQSVIQCGIDKVSDEKKHGLTTPKSHIHKP